MEHTNPPRAVSVVVHVTEDGRVIIPAPSMAELGVRADDRVSADIVGGEIVVDTRRAAIRRAQEALAPYIAAEPSVVDELIAERRAEALSE